MADVRAWLEQVIDWLDDDAVWENLAECNDREVNPVTILICLYWMLKDAERFAWDGKNDDFLKELKLTEGRNTGFPTAFAALRENGSDMPEFEMEPGRGYLTVRLPIHPYFLPQKKARDGEYENRILSKLENEALTMTDLARSMGYKGITQKLKKTLIR